jgi:hypothetical protein
VFLILILLAILACLLSIPLIAYKLTKVELVKGHWWPITWKYVEAQGALSGGKELLTGTYWYMAFAALFLPDDEGKYVFFGIVLCLAVCTSVLADGFIEIHKSIPSVARLSALVSFLWLVLLTIAYYFPNYQLSIHFIGVIISLYWGGKIMVCRAMFKLGGTEAKNA